MNRTSDGPSAPRAIAAAGAPGFRRAGWRRVEGLAARWIAPLHIGLSRSGRSSSPGRLGVVRNPIRTGVLAAALIGTLPAWADSGTERNERSAPAAETASRPAAAGLDAPASLHGAARTGDLDRLKAALAAGVDVDTRDGRGRTALMHAANENHPPLVEELLRAGADPDVRAPDGATPLFRAASHGYAQVIALLMEAEADPFIVGPRGRTAVDVARARFGFADRVLRSDEDPAVAALVEGRFRDCGECPEMVGVPAGSFTMGSPPDRWPRDRSEGPLTPVTIDAPFAVGKYEVTFDEWDSCVRGGGCGGHRPDDLGQGRGRRPVTDVSWNDAKSYLRWLSEETGKKYTLLTESKWEYAARAGTGSRYHFGAAIRPWLANYVPRGKWAHWAKRRAVPVGTYPPNGFGLHDVHGNVWEWVWDCWNESHEGAPSNGAMRWGRGDCGRVLRGGSWAGGFRQLRAANRWWNPSWLRSAHIGFRVARDCLAGRCRPSRPARAIRDRERTGAGAR